MGQFDLIVGRFKSVIIFENLFRVQLNDLIKCDDLITLQIDQINFIKDLDDEKSSP